jgi:glycosyltransferase involved in cell wall biosynthesis
MVGDMPVLYWSEEESNLWGCGTRIVRPHPIDTDVFKGYNPTKQMAITIATRAFSGWGPDLKGYNVLKDAYPEVPIQVVARDDQDFPNAISIDSEADMVKSLQEHQLYFNCAWKLDRSPLEAMGVGMPVIAIRNGFNVYKDYFNEENGNIVYAWNIAEMISKTKELLTDKERCQKIGIKARETIKKYWSPKLSRTGWNKAFEIALSQKQYGQ